MDRDIKQIFKKFLHRSKTAHKGDFGHLLVLAGSRGLTGAAALTCQAALRSGCGLVTLGIPNSLEPILEVKLTEAMTLGLPETEKQSLSEEAFAEIETFSKKCQAMAIGPGLSTQEETVRLTQKLVAKLNCPMILDADGLNAFENRTEGLCQHKQDLILTPHLGEFSRLTGHSVDDIQENMEPYALDFAKKTQSVVVLKSYQTIVADFDGQVYVHRGYNPGLAKGGMGDILTGMIAAFRTQGLPAFAAACWGVFYHGQAGEAAVKTVGEISCLPSDVLAILKQKIFYKKL